MLRVRDFPIWRFVLAVKCFEQDVCGKWWAVFDRPNHKGLRRSGAEKVACGSCGEKFLRLKGRNQVFCSSACRKGSSSGVRNSRWSGGSRLNAYGYVTVRPDVEDALALSLPTTSGGYVLEHRLVMARHLGRALLPNETVHHRNGVRADNRLENLELWATHHPRGQRVADLVNWAQEILGLYEDGVSVDGS